MEVQLRLRQRELEFLKENGFVIFSQDTVVYRLVVNENKDTVEVYHLEYDSHAGTTNMEELEALSRPNREVPRQPLMNKTIRRIRKLLW